MTITAEVSLADLFATVVLHLVHPTLACVCHAPVWLAPVEVLALARARIAVAVLQAFAGIGKVLGVSLCVGSELVVPLQSIPGVAEALGRFLAGCRMQYR